ncbi:hypothetical protein FZEAL_5322 [Fusarium zealandicum]|uniref:F-box domain-containing protein n=1 Tax=Fusarium zealandicum TaxID=1053134 RepID=A0A8H4XJW5_9HYPO|nr:hypothetical protein FZEAL_5322 [Fusarium zealandicum]
MSSRMDAASANSKGESTALYRLPRELRAMIYSCLFHSTRMTWGSKLAGHLDPVKAVPARNALAILGTCRQAKAEIGDSWVGQILFSFEDPQAMLDKLTDLPTGMLPKVRHLHVSGDSLLLKSTEGSTFYFLVSLLKLLPGLQLETLTVMSPSAAQGSNETLNCLIRESCGWKKLRYVSHSSKLLGFGEIGWPHLIEEHGRQKYRHSPQPSLWQRFMDERDGSSTRPLVIIYRSTMADSPGSINNANTRVRFEQKVPQDREAQEAFGLSQDPELVSDGEITKERLIIVRSGVGVDYEEKEGSPFLTPDVDIRQRYPGQTWEEIRSTGMDVSSWDAVRIEIDAYKDVDEYIWSASHFPPAVCV